jgi:ureidoglycolate lyase/seryl-tRNA synthetase
MSGYADYNGVDQYTEKDVIFLPTVIATNKSLETMGKLVSNFDEEECKLVSWPRNSNERPLMANTGHSPIMEDSFKIWWKDDMAHGHNLGLGNAPYDVGRMAPFDQSYLLTREINYHPDGSQIFFPKSQKPFLMVLGVPGDEIVWKPNNVLKIKGYIPCKFVTFYFDGTQGVHLYPGTWHQPPIPLTDSLEFFNKQAKTHACVGYDILKEDKKWFGIHLWGLNRMRVNPYYD